MDKENTCVWVAWEGDDSADTGCGQTWKFGEDCDVMEQLDMFNYCYNCGKPIKVEIKH